MHEGNVYLHEEKGKKEILEYANIQKVCGEFEFTRFLSNSFLCFCTI